MMEQKKYARFDEIKKDYLYRKQLLLIEYRDAMEKWLKENHLDGDVIRLKDGKKGQLMVVESYYESSMVYVLKFYPYTKTGKVSVKCDGWIYDPALEFDSV